MMDEYVSVVLPTYNRAHTLEKSMRSVLDQSYRNLELIVVDDCSTDETGQLVASIGDERVRYIKTPQNGGAGAARNYGIEHARYDYVAFQDSDDCWRQGKLKKQMAAIMAADSGKSKENATDRNAFGMDATDRNVFGMDTTDREVALVYHCIRYDFGDGRYCLLPPRDIAMERKSGNIYAQVLYDNLIGCPTLLAKRDALLAVGGFDTSLKALEDYDLAIKLTRVYNAAFIDEPLIDSTFSNTGVSGNSVNYLMASCEILARYKKDYLETGTFNHRVEVILRDSGELGMRDQFVKLMERMLV